MEEGKLELIQAILDSQKENTRLLADFHPKIKEELPQFVPKKPVFRIKYTPFIIKENNDV